MRLRACRGDRAAPKTDERAVQPANRGRDAAYTQVAIGMVFFYERHGQFIRCESRPAEPGPGFELLVVYPDGREEIEHFDDGAALNDRQLQLESHLTATGWFGPHGRVI